ncbi:MAG TPA: glycerophosphodiester phosphodiesterase family protein [Acetobacteraceae bacterium]|nr:glycerophosphodiester phosphodiesterase family protein [Acetobacteraceae bacterium]
MPDIEIWGHRGARGLFPENTLAGIQGALALGIDGVEIDIGLTADGVPVLCHDPRLSPDIARDPSGAWVEPPGPLLRALPATALARYDVGRLRPGSATRAAFPRQAPRDGARVPALAEVLALRAPLIIELKTLPDRPAETAAPAAMAASVAAAIRAAGAERTTVVESFDWRGPRLVRRLLPELRLAWLTRAETVAAAPLWWDGADPSAFGGSVPRAVAAAGRLGDAWAPDWATLAQDQVKEAHELGLRVIAWTVNDPAAMVRLAAWGVDALITDYPDLALATVRGG